VGYSVSGALTLCFDTFRATGNFPLLVANSTLLPLNVYPFSATIGQDSAQAFIPSGPNHAQACAESIHADAVTLAILSSAGAQSS